MKITDVTYTVHEYPVEYKGERIKRDEEGNAVLERGRPKTEKVYNIILKKSLNFLYLIRDGETAEWMREGDIVRKYGKKKFKEAHRSFLTKDKIEQIAETFRKQEGPA